ncbi:MAG TPA: HAD-IB family phosphatase [Bryobacteraceae bacterium]|nr:HAD-IB family phosphatase [Bryobacteraceae bacterium]
MRSILISDFDGTITEHEFYALVLARNSGVPDYFAELQQGRLTHFEAMAAVFSHAPSDQAALDEMLAAMHPDARFASAVDLLRQAGWELVIASAGSAWYIERVLRAAGVDATVHASPGRIEPGRGLVLEPPRNSAYYHPERGIDKEALVRDALERSDRVAFAGDGPLDLGPALMVEPRFRFARRWLARELRRRREPFHVFEHWPDIVGELLRDSTI